MESYCFIMKNTFILENYENNDTDTSDEEKVISPKKKHFHMLKIQDFQKKLLIGVKGRNIALVRKHSDMGIFFNEITNEVYMTVNLHNMQNHSKAKNAWQFTLSVCFGGIIKWFENINSVTQKYPISKKETCIQVALKHQCSLDLIKSSKNKNHFCLILLPQLNFPDFFDEKITYKDFQESLLLMQQARENISNFLFQ